MEKNEMKEYKHGEKISANGKECVIPDWCTVFEIKECGDCVPCAKISLHNEKGELLCDVAHIEGKSKEDLNKSLNFAYSCLIDFFNMGFPKEYEFKLMIKG